MAKRRKKRSKMGHRGLSKKPVKVGLTGSLASGKTTVLGHFKKLGWAVNSADDVVAEIYKEKGLTKKDLREKYGSSPRKLKQLEKWVHPLVEKRLRAWMKKTKKPVIVEIPLLFETKMEKNFDYTVYIFAPKGDRKKWATRKNQGRPKMPPKLFEFLEGQQLTPRQKTERADFILHNRSRARMKNQVKLLSKLLKLCS